MEEPKVDQKQKTSTAEDFNPETFDTTAFWQQQYDAAASGGQNFLFFKKERTRVRLMAHTRDPRQWVREVESIYQGDKSKKFLVPGYEITQVDGQTEFLFQMITLTKGAWASLTQMIIEGHKFFEPDGKALTVVRNPGPPVSYTLMPSPSTVPPHPEMWEAAQGFEWDFYLDEFQKMQDGKRGSGQGSTNSLADSIVNANPQPINQEPW